jgi:hypothetical protein
MICYTARVVALLVLLAAVITLFVGCTPILTHPEVVKEPVVERCQIPEIKPPVLYVDKVDPADPRALVTGRRAMEAEIKAREAHRLELEVAIEACRRHLAHPAPDNR